MSRKPDPARKNEILESLVDYAYEQGLSDFSLRPVAEALGTSPRMLLYHFGSKEQLLVETVEACRERQYVMLEAWLADESLTFEMVVRKFWAWWTGSETEAYARLFFEIFGLSVQDRPGFAGFAEAAIRSPLGFMERGFTRDGCPPEEARTKATIMVTVIRGLTMDLLATGERERVDGAFEALLGSLFFRERSTPGGFGPAGAVPTNRL